MENVNNLFTAAKQIWQMGLKQNSLIWADQWLLTNFTLVLLPVIPLWVNWPVSFNRTCFTFVWQMLFTFKNMKTISTQVNISHQNSFQDYLHPGNHTIYWTTDTSGCKLFYLFKTCFVMCTVYEQKFCSEKKELCWDL